jgi:chromosome segregation protein
VHITRLTLKGFKSFPQKPVSVQFERGLNSITGPNGSGKSNIIDAIRFVMGENSPKALRHSKMSDLIHDQQQDETAFARISLTLDNSDRSMPLDDDKVVVIRELRHNGDSVYFVNGRRTARNQYLELLSAAHLSYDGLNIIAQGTIQRLAELNPDEKRAAVEQYLGLKHFDEKKAEAMARLREADNELAISFAKLDERRESIERLQAERNDALRFKQIRYEISRIRKAVLLRDIDRLEAEIEEHRKRLGELSRLREEYEKNIARLQEDKRALEAQRDEYYSARVAGPNRRLTEINVTISRLQSELEAHRLRREELLSLKLQLDEAVPRLSEMLNSADAERRSLLSHIEDLRQRITDSGVLISQLGERATSLRLEREKLQRKLVSVSKKDSAYLGRLAVVTERIRNLNEALGVTRQRTEQLRQELAESTKKQSDLASMSSTFEQKVEELATALPEKIADLQKLEQRIADIKGQRKRLAKELAEAESVLNESFQTVARYSSGMELAERFLGEELNVAKIEELAQSGAIPGFHGPLSGLIKFAKKYSSAIRAAGQDWLYAFVVDDMTSLLHLASLAKRLRTGRIRILPLSELAGLPAAEAPAEGGVLGTLSDYIECEERFRPAVDFVFGNTVLVASAKVAFLLSRAGHRCITPLGDLFEPRGSALETGRVSDVTFKQIGLSDVDSIRLAEDSLRALKESLERRRKGLEKLERLQSELEESRFAALLEIREQESNLKTYRAFVKRYKSLAARANARVSNLQRSLNSGLRREEAQGRRLSRLQEASAKLIKRREALGLSSLAERFRAVEEELARISVEVDSRSSEVSRMNAEISGFEATLNGEVDPRMGQIRISLEKSEKELKEAMDEIPKVESRIPEIEREIARLTEEEKVVREEDERALPRLQELEQLIKRKEEQIASEQQKILRLDREDVKVDGAIQSVESARQLLRNELQGLGVAEEVYYSPGFDLLLQDLQAEEEELRNSVNLLAPQTYQEAFKSYRSASERRNELERDRNAIVSFVEKVEAEKKSAFMQAYQRLDKEVREIFSKLTGGEAWLELENPDDPFGGGIFLMAKFPKGSSRESSSLSGGEKAIVAVAFLLAFQTIYPSGFYLLDEVDAALDPMYAQGLGNLLFEWAGRAQILVVSLKESVIRKAGNVIGVYMTGGSSNAVRLKKEVAVDVRTG